MKMRLPWAWLFVWLSQVDRSKSFISTSNQQTHTRAITTQLFQFDISKPIFDVYSLRQVRGDALTKYNSLNQSEPLRINLSLLAAFALLSSPFLAPEVTGDDLTLPQTALAAVGTIGASANFVRECKRRSKQLTRLEKELSALSLLLRLPQNLLADSPFRKPQAVISACRKGMRILALYGTQAELQKTISTAFIFGRRFEQASVVVVPVPTDGDSINLERAAWIALPDNIGEWREYFGTLDDDDNISKWFGLSSSGRSFGSGLDISNVSWIQLLGQHLRPTVVVLDEDDENSEDKSGVVKQLTSFYSALTEGSLAEMQSLCWGESSDVSAVIREGGRLDAWDSCLQPGNRPEGMKVADADVTIISETLAYSSCVEFPVMDSAQLLACQTWKRTNNGDPWKLALHQTIPWTDDRAAAGTLLCDCRGCVSLTRTR